MANYNTFNVIDCKSRKSILTTSSARKASKLLGIGIRVEVWNNNQLVNTIYDRNKEDLKSYIRIEKDYIAEKQKRAEERNKRRKARVLARLNQGAV